MIAKEIRFSTIVSKHRRGAQAELLVFNPSAGTVQQISPQPELSAIAEFFEVLLNASKITQGEKTIEKASENSLSNMAFPGIVGRINFGQ